MSFITYHGSHELLPELSGFVDVSKVGTSGNGHLADFPGLYLARDKRVAEHYAMNADAPVLAEVKLSDYVVLLNADGSLDDQPIDVDDLIDALYPEDLRTDLIDFIAEHGGYNADEEKAARVLLLGEYDPNTLSDTGIEESVLQAFIQQRHSGNRLDFHATDTGMGDAILAEFKAVFGDQAPHKLKALLGVDGINLLNRANPIQDAPDNILLWSYDNVISVVNYDLEGNKIEPVPQERNALLGLITKMHGICEALQTNCSDVLTRDQLRFEAKRQIVDELSINLSVSQVNILLSGTLASTQEQFLKIWSVEKIAPDTRSADVSPCLEPAPVRASVSRGR